MLHLPISFIAVHVLCLELTAVPSPWEGPRNREEGPNAVEHRTATKEPSAFFIAHHRAPTAAFPHHNPPHFHTRIPRQQRSRGAPAQPLRGAAHLKGLELRDGDLENFCRAFSWRYHGSILQCP